MRRRAFLGLVLAAAAALTAGRLGLAFPPDKGPGTKPGPRGWREARHWRKI